MRLILFLTLAICISCNASLYEGYHVIRIFPKGYAAIERVQLLKNLPGITLWKHHVQPEESYDFMVSPQYFEPFMKQMKKLNIKTIEMINNVQKLIEKQTLENEKAKHARKPQTTNIDNTYYRNLTEIYSQLESFAANNPDLMSVSSIGTTLEGRDMKLMKISSAKHNQRKIIWIDCGIHAREWITPATCLYIVDSLNNYGDDKEITDLVDTYDFYILTVNNPDGYDYTWTTDRLWRKNRNPSSNGCYGVDINRNFDANFGGVGTSDAPCVETYHGESAFSEKESQAVRDIILSVKDRVKMVYSIHSYSQLWMYPYAYTHDLPRGAKLLHRISRIGVEALTAVYGTSYKYGPTADTIYPCSGITIDWTFDSADVFHSYTLELRDKGLHGFLLPADQIEPTAIETWEGLKAAIKAVR